MSPHRQLLVAHSFLLLLVAVTTGHRFANGFALDDETVIVRGEVIHDPANLAGIWTHHAMFVVDADPGVQPVDTYRPLPLTTFVVDALVSGHEPWMYHLTGMTLHVLVTWLVFALLRRTIPDVEDAEAAGWRCGSAVYGAAVFAAHPWLVEAHGWINGRSDTLALLFVLVAALALGRESRRAFLLAGVAWGLALLSKETALLLLPALATTPRSWTEGPTRRALFARAALLSGIALAYLVARGFVLGGIRAGSGARLQAALVRMPLVLADGVRALVVPELAYLRSLSEELPPTPLGIAGASALVVALLVFAIVSVRRRPVLSWALLWLAPLVPVAVIATSIWPGFGRYLYMPAVALALLVSGAAALARRASVVVRRALSVAALVHVALLGLLAADYTTQFRSSEALYRRSIELHPELGMGYGFLGMQERRQSRFAEALPLLEAAVARDPDELRYRLHLVASLIHLGRAPEAHAAAVAAIGEVPSQPLASGLYYYAATTMPARSPDGVVSFLVTCLELMPDRPDCLSALRSLLTQAPDRGANRAAFERRVGRSPQEESLRAALR